MLADAGAPAILALVPDAVMLAAACASAVLAFAPAAFAPAHTGQVRARSSSATLAGAGAADAGIACSGSVGDLKRICAAPSARLVSPGSYRFAGCRSAKRA